LKELNIIGKIASVVAKLVGKMYFCGPIRDVAI
jgi:hypothetical protein